MESKIIHEQINFFYMFDEYPLMTVTWRHNNVKLRKILTIHH